MNRVDGVEFVVSNEEKYKEDAQLRAVRAAKEKAAVMAAELGQSIGEPWEITEESSFYPNLTANFSLSKMPPQEMQSTISGGELTIRASTRVSFKLQ